MWTLTWTQVKGQFVEVFNFTAETHCLSYFEIMQLCTILVLIIIVLTFLLNGCMTAVLTGYCLFEYVSDTLLFNVFLSACFVIFLFICLRF